MNETYETGLRIRKETLFQSAVYWGGPAGAEACRLAGEVIDELGVEIEALDRFGSVPARPA